MMRVLPAETAMAIQERILAGASLRQIMGEFGIGKGTVSRYRAIVLSQPKRATRCDVIGHSRFWKLPVQLSCAGTRTFCDCRKTSKD